MTAAPSIDPFAKLNDYELRHLVAHLEKADRAQELHCLLAWETATGRNAWYQARRAHGDLAGYTGDLMRAMRLTRDGPVGESDKNEQTPGLHLQVRYCLMLASLRSLAINVTPGLLAALVDRGYWSLGTALGNVENIADNDEKARALASIADRFPGAERIRISKEALGLIRQIHSPAQRASAVVNLLPYLPSELRHDTVASILPSILEADDGGGSASLLEALGPYLSDAQFEQAYSVFCSLPDGYAVSRLIIGSFPHLQDNRRAEVLGDALHFAFERYKADILTACAPYLTETLLRQALKSAMAFRGQISRDRALEALLPPMTEYLSYSELDAALGWMAQPTLRAKAIVAMARRDPSFVPAARDAAAQLPDPVQRVAVLSMLLAASPRAVQADDLRAALRTARQIRDPHDRAMALIGLVPAAEQQAVDAQERERITHEAWSACLRVADEKSRVDAFEAIVPQGGPSLLAEGLSFQRGIRDESLRARALAALARFAPTHLLADTFQEILSIDHRTAGQQAIPALLARAPDSLVPDVVAATHRICDDAERTVSILRLIPFMAETDRVIRQAEPIKEIESLDDPQLRADLFISILAASPQAARKSILQRALSAADHVEPDVRRCEMLVALFPSLEARARRRYHKRILKIVKRIPDPDKRAEALLQVQPCLPLRTRALIGTMEPELLYALFLEVMEIDDDGDRCRLLARLAKHAFAAFRYIMLRQATWALFQIDDAASQGRALAEMAIHVGTIVELEQSASYTGQDPRADANELIAGLQAELVRRRGQLNALATSGALAEARSRIGLPPEGSREAEPIARIMNRTAHDMARQFGVTSLQGQAGIDHMALGWSASLRSQMFSSLALWRLERACTFHEPHLADRLLQVTPHVPGEKERARILDGLVPFLSDVQLGSALAAACEIKNGADRARLLGKLARRLGESEPEAARGCWQPIIAALAARPRADLLADLGHLGPWLRRLGGVDLIADAARETERVARWWP